MTPPLALVWLHVSARYKTVRLRALERPIGHDAGPRTSNFTASNTLSKLKRAAKDGGYGLGIRSRHAHGSRYSLRTPHPHTRDTLVLSGTFRST